MRKNSSALDTRESEDRQFKLEIQVGARLPITSQYFQYKTMETF